MDGWMDGWTDEQKEGGKEREIDRLYLSTDNLSAINIKNEIYVNMLAIDKTHLQTTLYPTLNVNLNYKLLSTITVPQRTCFVNKYVEAPLPRKVILFNGATSRRFTCFGSILR